MNLNYSESFGRARLATPAAGRRRSFVVGLLIPTSGTMGLLGPSAYACARMARDSWNRQDGVAGRDVQLHLIDSGETAVLLEDELRDLLGRGALDALVVLSNTAVCRRVASLVDARIPLIYTPLFEGAGLPTWVHAIGETPERQLLPAIDWMTERFRTRRWYLLGNDYSWPRRTHALAAAHLRSIGGEVVRERYVALGEQNYGTVVADIARSGADIVLVSLLAGDAVRMGREFERAELGHKVLRLSTCVEENAVLGVGPTHSDGMFIAAGYFAALDSDENSAFKERYHARFGDRAPTLNSASQSVYEGMVHLQRQTGTAGRRCLLPSARNLLGGGYDAGRDPIYLGQVQGLGIQPLRPLSGKPG